uniref:397aa long hypothetical protein n=1 Tax=Pyrococcus horikoshii (strain ATCC 700860 / DSM 12428 / JCM 9974 / NBRC 100139 / OT-3) TaxID=70601 RepID=UPI0000F24407|nr:Chain A, Primase large subunit amino terminal domain from Pyrococcus horikoshii [Pyrococcus horikoshii OT3]2DLA_B Chain B, Primase large subunit amino terminal domain from Pyrococcus horikoshii [Pyrococcus horikoshii OT3]2DLA_C Chain C, Primase large subunit amino terminal domain from Pyrococcus horikoshii [Pyrococcus horikoshii OT3]
MMIMLDPFSEKAKELLKGFGSINDFMDAIPKIVSVDDVIERIRVVKNEKLIDKFLDQDNVMDLAQFYALLGALSYSPYGIELELVKKANLIIYSERLKRKKEIKPEEISIDVSTAIEFPTEDVRKIERVYGKIPEYTMKISDFLDLVPDEKLANYYIYEGRVYLKREDLIRIWSKAFERNVERGVNMLYEIRDELPEFYRKVLGEIQAFAEEEFGRKFGEIQ